MKTGITLFPLALASVLVRVKANPAVKEQRDASFDFAPPGDGCTVLAQGRYEVLGGQASVVFMSSGMKPYCKDDDRYKDIDTHVAPFELAAGNEWVVYGGLGHDKDAERINPDDAWSPFNHGE